MSFSDSIWLLALLTAALVVILYAVRHPRQNVAGTALEGEISAPPTALRPEATELLIGRSATTPAIRISALSSNSITSSAKLLGIEQSRLATLTPLLQAVPSLLAEFEFASGGYMKVVVDGSLARAPDGAAFLPFVRGADGKISALALLKDPSLLGGLISGAALWQMLSLVMAQKHLADISEKLEAIQLAVEDVREFQLNERRAKVIAITHYLNQFVPAIQAGELSDVVRIALESNEIDLLQIQNHLRTDIQNHIDRIPTINSTERVGTKELFHALTLHEKRLSGHLQDMTFCTMAKAMNWRVLALYPGERVLKESRLNDIRNVLGEFVGPVTVISKSTKVGNERLEAVTALFNREVTLEHRRVQLRTHINQTARHLQDALTPLTGSLDDGASFLQEIEQPLTLAVKMEGGRLVEAYKLQNHTMPVSNQ